MYLSEEVKPVMPQPAQSARPASASAVLIAPGEPAFPPQPRRLIRPALPSDIPDITAIYTRFVTSTTATSEITPPDQAEMARRRQATLDHGLPYLVAELEGFVVGFCYASQFRPREGYRCTVEDSIYVRPDCIGHGLGKLLLGRLMAECQDCGCHSIVACICGLNVQSTALHTALGFQQVGLLPDAVFKCNEWLRLLIMQRPL